MKNNTKNLLFALAWLLFGALSVFTKDEIVWSDYGYFVISVLYFGSFFYNKLDDTKK